MKKIIRTAIAVLMLAGFASCNGDDPIKPTPDGDKPGTEKPGTEKPTLNENIKFTLEVKEVTADKAKIQVKHNGTSSDTYYGFATDAENWKEALAAKITELTAEGKVRGLKKMVSTTFSISSLTPDTQYTFVVFGITEDGTTYGTPATIEFKTKRGEVEMVENAAWTVSYTGKGTINNTEYEHTISVKSTDENTYFISSCDKASFEAKDIKEIAKEELEYLKQTVAYLQQQPEYKNLTIQDMLFKGDGIDAMNLIPGDWYGIAIGVDESGELSGLYAAAPFTIEEEEATAEYSAWIGNWTWTGSNGVSFDVTFDHYINNNSYILTGWEGTYEWPFLVTWEPEDEIWYIMSANIGEAQFGEQEGYVYITGMSTDGYIWPTDPICVGGFDEAGNRVSYGYPIEYEGKTYEIAQMLYIGVIGDEVGAGIMGVKEWPTFPITITPNTKAAPASVEKEYKSVCKFTKAPKPIMTFYKSYMNCNIR